MPNNGIISRQAVIPSEFLVSSVESTDLVIINTPTTGNKVQQKAVPVSELTGGSSPYKEVFFRTNYFNSIQYGFSTLSSNTLTISQNATGDFILNIQNSADRPADIYKIEVNADVNGGYGVENDIWRVAVDPGSASSGTVRFYTYKYNTTTSSWGLANPVSSWHPVHIRIYS